MPDMKLKCQAKYIFPLFVCLLLLTTGGLVPDGSPQENLMSFFGMSARVTGPVQGTILRTEISLLPFCNIIILTRIPKQSCLYEIVV